MDGFAHDKLVERKHRTKTVNRPRPSKLLTPAGGAAPTLRV
jgi:hypothetical protein